MDKARIISVEVTKGDAGLYHATSPQMKELFLSGLSIEEVTEGVPELIAAIYERRGISVSVYQAEDENSSLPMPWVIVGQDAHRNHC